MDSAVYDSLAQTLAARGGAAAIDQLCTTLREQRDYHRLFYAMLMRKRHELGVSPIPTAPSTELPDGVLTPYEDAIRAAAREIGDLFLRDGDLPQAYGYLRMIGETGPVREALAALEPAEDIDLEPLVNIAFFEGVHPRRGFSWILRRYGICRAITTLGGQQMPQSAEDRQDCIQQLVRALHAELCERLLGEIERHDSTRPEAANNVPKLMVSRDWLFADDGYHVDMSHLSSVVQMSINLPGCPELGLARELCAYGQRLSDKYVGPGEPPFENQYQAYDHYLSILQGENVDEALAYFRRQVAELNLDEVGTYPVEVLVNLLLRVNRGAEALGIARKYLANLDGRQLSCPGVADLCRQVGDYRTLAETAREQGDVVHFLAGLLAERK